jgi:hypothetical protein
MSEIIIKSGIEKESGYLYFLDKDGDIGRTVATKGSVKDRKQGNEKVLKLGIEKEPGYLYFISKDGDVGRGKLKRGR